ncbi:MAG: hypothetical protein IKQ55_13400 [Kiritimatiellae bacterium]|jgi:hypothetical protein|nr:hypothetical protein [Kiritimatiellia bacterium]
MKKLAILLVALVALSTAAPAVVAHETGGLGGAIIGCCFGVRSAAAYNDGKDLHWREWGRLIPFASFVFAIWDGVDGLNGRTTGNLASEYGASYY